MLQNKKTDSEFIKLLFCLVLSLRYYYRCLDTTDVNASILGDGFIYEDIALRMEFLKSFMVSEFELDKNGVTGQALAETISGPTSVGPQDLEFDIVVDKPFYFVSTFQDIPLFAGRIVSL